MPDMLPDSTDFLRQLGAVLAGQRDIRLAYVFGSMAQGREDIDSDLDIAVLADRPLTASRKMALIDLLAPLAGRPVDLIDLATAGEPLTGQVLIGRRIQGSDVDHAALVYRHVTDAEDFLPYLNRLLRERRHAWTSR